MPGHIPGIYIGEHEGRPQDRRRRCRRFLARMKATLERFLGDAGDPSTLTESHVAPILTTDRKQRVGDLAESADLGRFHQLLEHVPVVKRDLLQAF